MSKTMIQTVLITAAGFFVGQWAYDMYNKRSAS